MTGAEGAGLPARRFTEAEVAAILRRAADAEARPDVPAPHDPTLADLMAAAAEAGLDPAQVRRAAALVPTPGGGLAALVLGAPDHREVAAVLEGVTFAEPDDAFVRSAERTLGARGEVVERGPGRFVWREEHPGGRTTVEVTSDGGDTRMLVRADRAGHYLGLWFGGLVAWALASALTPLSLPPLPALLALVAIPPLLVRPVWVRSDRRLRERLERAVLELCRAVEERAAVPPRAPLGDGAPPSAS